MSTLEWPAKAGNDAPLEFGQLADVGQALRASELFGVLPEAALGQLERLSSARRWGGGSLLFLQGDPANSLFIIVKGEIEVCWRPDHEGNKDGRKGITVAKLGPGRTIGWGSLIAPFKYTAEAWTVGGATAIVLDAHGVRALMQSDPALGFRITERLAAILAARLTQAYGVLDSLV